jgi:hypothetical protein
MHKSTRFIKLLKPGVSEIIRFCFYNFNTQIMVTSALRVTHAPAIASDTGSEKGLRKQGDRCVSKRYCTLLETHAEHTNVR